jgi:hypothetical protein
MHGHVTVKFIYERIYYNGTALIKTEIKVQRGNGTGNGEEKTPPSDTDR